MLFLILFFLGNLDSVTSWQCPNWKVIPEIYTKSGQPAIIGFQTTLQTFDGGLVYNVAAFNNSFLYSANYYNNDFKRDNSYFESEFIGDARRGNFTVKTNGVQRQDGGVYMLQYKRGALAWYTEICSMLFVLAKPLKATMAHDSNNVIGRNSQLTCQSSSTTYPTNHTLQLTYNWRVNGVTNPSTTKYSYGDGRKTLTLISVNKEDSNKTFECSATESGNIVNGFTSDYSDKFLFTVIYGPDSSTTELTPLNTEYTLNEGARLNDITCIGNCYPRCNFKWTKSKTNGVSVVSNDAVLSLGTLSRAEAATYTCEVTNANTTVRTVRNQVVVNVNYGPDASTTKLTPSSVTYTHNEGDSLNHIQCSGSCYPSCNYKWTKSGISTSVNNATISLGSLDRTEAGSYTCTVSNPSTGDKQTKIVSIFVRYGPDVCSISSVSPLTLTEGESSPTVSCESECYPSCSHTWSNMSSNGPISNNGKFQLVKATRYKAGSYKCFCRNTATVHYAKNQTAILHIVIQYPPDLSMLLSTENTTEGNELTIRCDAHGVPSVYNYNGLNQTWNGSPVPNTHREVSGTPRHSTLYIPSLQLQDTGTYICFVNNGVKTADTVSSGIVKVKVLPKLLTRILQFVGETEGTANVSVQFYSFPDIQEVVFKHYDNQTITNGTAKYKVSHYKTTVWEKFYGKEVSLRGMQANMIISDLKQGNFGSYTLILQNELGKTIVPFSIHAESEPSAPTGFKYIFKVGTHSFTWHGGFNGGQLQTFIVQTSIAGQDTWQNITTVTEKMDAQNVVTYWANVSSFPRGTYSARLYAWNVYGKSDYVSLNSTFRITRGAQQYNSAAVTAGAVGGACSAFIVIAVIVVVVVLVRREIITKDSIMTSIQIVFRKKQKETVLDTDGQDNSIMMYEQLTHSTNSEQTNMYDALKVDSQAKDNSADQYENLPKDATTPPTYINIAAGSKVSKGANQTYENLKLHTKIITDGK